MDFLFLAFGFKPGLDKNNLTAFDKVPHQHLLLKLKNMGISGNLLSWVQDWLCNRKQRVVVRGCAYSWQEVTSGVPQGSVLGPLMFVTFINVLDPDILCRAKKFADDTKLNSDFPRSLPKVIQRSFKWIWIRFSLGLRQMLFSIDKCKVMHFGSTTLGILIL